MSVVLIFFHPAISLLKEVSATSLLMSGGPTLVSKLIVVVESFPSFPATVRVIVKHNAALCSLMTHDKEPRYPSAAPIATIAITTSRGLLRSAGGLYALTR